MTTNRFMVFVAFATFATGLARADVLDVGGANPDAADIATAVNLASEGDVIRIYPGAYTDFVVSGKSLTFVPSVPGGRIVIAGVIQINDLAVGQSVELYRFGGGSSHTGIWGQNCAGSIRLYEGVFRGFNAFVQCEDIVAVSSSFVGGFGGTSEAGFAGLQAENSRLALYRCSLLGGNGGDGYTGGNCLLHHLSDGGWGGPGLGLEGTGEVFLSLSISQGGQGGDGDDICYGDFGGTGAGISASSSAQYDIRMLHSGASSLSLNTQSAVANLPGEARRLAGPDYLYDTETLTVRLFGEVGEHAGLFFSTGHAYETAPIGGPLLVQVPTGPALTSWQYVGRIGGEGYLDASFPLRDLPPFAHANLHIVGVTSSSSGRNFTNSITPLVLDTAW